MTDMSERVAELEEQVESLRIREAVAMRQTKEIEDKLDNLLSKFNEVLTELNRFKGFVGGIMFLVGCAVTFVNIVGLDWLKKHVF